MRVSPFIVALAGSLALHVAPAHATPRTALHRGLPLAQSASAQTVEAALRNADPSLRSVNLSPRDTRVLPDGHAIVRFRQQHAGIPVLGRGASVMLAGAGRSFGATRVVTRFPSATTPTLAAQSAAQVAGARAQVDLSAKDAALVWLPVGNGAQLVWGFYGGMPAAIPYVPVVMVDAHSGKVVLSVNAVKHDRAATVHPFNPVATPTTESVILEALTPGATTLTTELIKVQNCVDKQTLSGGQFKIHVCEMEQKAVADAQGDFPYVYEGDTWLEDEHAEVAFFYHATKVYSHMQSLGLPALDAKPLNGIVNLRMPQGYSNFDFSKMKDTSLPLEPYNNAFYSPQSPFGSGFGPKGEGLWFGQGTYADFAYDGDVVYHEFGHAVMGHTIDFSHYWHVDEQGATVAPGAMNEGLADYFSSAITGDGNVGEYGAKNVTAGFGGVIRSLDNDHSCPGQLSGEVHTDSTLFSGALWSVRKTLPDANRVELDAAVLAALMTAPSGDLGYEDLAELIAAAVETSPLGATGAKAVRDEFTKRGVLPGCSRVLEVDSGPINGPEFLLQYSFYAPGFDRVPVVDGAPYVPGLLQFHKALPEKAETLNVSWVHQEPSQQQGFGRNSKPYDPALVVRFDETPIVFDLSTGVANGDLIEAKSVGGSWSAEVPIPAGATDVHVMIVNRGDELALYRGLSITAKEPKPPPPPPGTGGFSGIGGSGATGGSSVTPDDDLSPAGGGCACRMGHAPAQGAWLALAGALLVAMRRRVRRSARRDS